MQARRKMTKRRVTKWSSWIFDPLQVEKVFYQTPYDELKPDKHYAYRGVGSKEEVLHVLKGGKSGGFWSNYPEKGYIRAALFITKNPCPGVPKLNGEVIKSEIPCPIHQPFEEIEAIYLNTANWGHRIRHLIRIKPIMTLEEWLRYYNKHRPGREELHKRLYFKLYDLPEVLDLLESSKYPEYWEWAKWIRENKSKYLP